VLDEAVEAAVVRGLTKDREVCEASVGTLGRTGTDLLPKRVNCLAGVMSIRSRITKPTLVAAAVGLAVGASAAPAASLISGSQIKPGTISITKLTPSALKVLQTPRNITGSQIKSGSLELSKLSDTARTTLLTTATNPPTGTSGPVLLSAYVTAEGVLSGGLGVTGFDRKSVGTGTVSMVTFNRSVAGCTRVASVGYANEGPDVAPSGQGFAVITRLEFGKPNTVGVLAGSGTYAPFHLIVLCPPK